MKSWIRTLFILSLWLSQQALADTLTYEIEGVKNPVLENIEGQLAIDQKSEPQPLGKKSIHALYKRAPETILSAMQPFGYFKPTITSVRLSKKGAGKWQANFKINQGQPLRITHYRFQIHGEGANAKDIQAIIKKSPLKTGAIFNSQEYETYKRSLLNKAIGLGFLDAKFITHKITVDLPSYTSSIDLNFDTGPQYYFGPVNFEQTFFDSSFLHRFVPFKAGEPYRADKLVQLQQDLTGTEYFASVSVHPKEHNSSQREVPITVRLTPSKAKHYSLGIGYGTDTGPRGTVAIDLRHLTDTGHHIKSFLQLSQVQNTMEARYVIPGKNPVSDQYFFGASMMHEEPNDSKGDTQKLTWGYADEYHGWRRTVTLNYQWDQYNIRKDPKRYTHLFLPSVTLSRSKADDPLFPLNGYGISINLQGSAEPLLSSTTFAQALIKGQYIFSPTDKDRIVLRGDFGYTAVKDKDLPDIPLSLQYFAGGADSIRGYDYQELGPGRYLIVGSAEFQHEVVPSWYGAVFVDAGNAINSFSDPEDSTIGTKQANVNLSELLKYSAGVGVVWASPVGPLELTLAKPITDSHKKVRLQFTMGTNL